MSAPGPAAMRTGAMRSGAARPGPSRVDLVIENALLVSPDGQRPGALAVENGRIVALGRDEAMPPARERLDAGGRPLIPGAIDVHVHVRDPGLTHKETWASATAAAAAGGVTTILDMPNTNPATATAAAVREKLAIAQPQAVVDFGVYGYIGEGNVHDLEPMAAAGAAAFKLYLASDNPLVPSPNDGAVLEALALIAGLGRRVTVHAENNAILAWRGRQLQQAGRTDLAAHLEQHADVAAVEATSRAALFGEWTGCPIHIAHENGRHALPILADAKQRGVNLTAETCPHYLLLSMDDAERAGGNALRVKPPLREAGHAEPLWNALRSGLIDILSTDHAPHLPAEKRGASIWDVAPGFPGVELSMRLMLTEVAAGRLTLPDYVRMACEAPARAFGLGPAKGALRVGADADLVVLDLGVRRTIRGAELHSPGNLTPFEGRETVGGPAMTFVRGRLVAEKGRVVALPGHGRPVRVESRPLPSATGAEMGWLAASWRRRPEPVTGSADGPKAVQAASSPPRDAVRVRDSRAGRAPSSPDKR